MSGIFSRKSKVVRAKNLSHFEFKTNVLVSAYLIGYKFSSENVSNFFSHFKQFDISQME